VDGRWAQTRTPCCQSTAACSRLRCISMNRRIHPTAIVEGGVEIGAGSSIWDNVHIRHPTRIGEECNVGERTNIA
jgi:UDP-3-O-[3-hydroxymyristoyl] glucosamine N-acyltransferase